MADEIPIFCVLSCGTAIARLDPDESFPKSIQAAYLMEHGDAERSTLLSQIYHPVFSHGGGPLGGAVFRLELISNSVVNRDDDLRFWQFYGPNARVIIPDKCFQVKIS
jgi:hypothetical protein